MKSKKLIALLLTAALMSCIVLAGCGSSGSSDTTASSAPAASSDAAPAASEDKPVTLRFAIYLASGSRYETLVVDPFIKAVEERSNGSIKFEVHPGATLCAADQVLDAVKDGLCDIGWLYTGNYTGALPLTFMFEYPTYFASAKASSYALRDYLNELQPAELDGTHLLMAFTSGEGILINNQKDIKSPDDLKGLEIRVNGVMAETISAFGGTPVAMVASEAYEAIRSGIVDGYMATPDSVNNFKLYEVTNHATRVHFCNTSHLTLMNQASYDKLSDNQKKILDECAAAGAGRFEELVKNEWRVETCFEGDRYYNLRRWAKSVDDVNVAIHGAKISAEGEYQLDNVVETLKFPSLWAPIPYTDIRRCANLVQNEGWETWR